VPYSTIIFVMKVELAAEIASKKVWAMPNFELMYAYAA
jgi:hypothetical protein